MAVNPRPSRNRPPRTRCFLRKVVSRTGIEPARSGPQTTPANGQEPTRQDGHAKPHDALPLSHGTSLPVALRPRSEGEQAREGANSLTAVDRGVKLRPRAALRQEVAMLSRLIFELRLRRVSISAGRDSCLEVLGRHRPLSRGPPQIKRHLRQSGSGLIKGRRAGRCHHDLRDRRPTEPDRTAYRPRCRSEHPAHRQARLRFDECPLEAVTEFAACDGDVAVCL